MNTTAKFLIVPPTTSVAEIKQYAQLLNAELVSTPKGLRIRTRDRQEISVSCHHASIIIH